MKQCAIAVIDYKPSLNGHEKISLQQCSRVLKDYDLFLVSHKGMDLSEHIHAIGRPGLPNILTFPRHFFASLQGYNRLLKSVGFFRAFASYEYILIYHTDSFVFSDELSYWCEKGYDYIGAPLYQFDGTIAPPDANFICTGNGGFSLHRVSSAMEVLSTFRRVYSFKDLWEWYAVYSLKGKVYFLPYFLRMISGLGGNSHEGLNHLRVNEDIFWGKYVPRSFPRFKVAPFADAYKFSMEYNCERLFGLNEGQLPFGCHRWYKQEFLNFWKDKIEQFRVQ
jgi:hypothetical protein